MREWNQPSSFIVCLTTGYGVGHRRRNREGGAPGACALPSFYKLLYKLLTPLYVVSNCAPSNQKVFPTPLWVINISVQSTEIFLPVVISISLEVHLCNTVCKFVSTIFVSNFWEIGMVDYFCMAASGLSTGWKKNCVMYNICLNTVMSLWVLWGGNTLVGAILSWIYQGDSLSYQYTVYASKWLISQLF